MKVWAYISSIILLVLIVACSEKEQKINLNISDGPYISVTEGGLYAEWICNGEVNSRTIAGKQENYTFSECGLSAQLRSSEVVPDLVEYQGEFKLAALSDIHGQYNLMLQLFKNNGIIDADNNWNFADGHLVITGDVLDRGEKQTEILWFLYHLERQALEAGGKLHLLLGNHEVMVLNGDLRYLNNKYQYTAALLDRRYQSLFTEETILGNWLRSKNVLVKVNDSLFTHAGFHPDLVSANLSLSVINRIFKEHLVESELESPRVGMAEYLYKKSGPIWFRGYFKDDKATLDQVHSLLEHFDVNHIVVGHTSQDKIETRYQGKVIAIDSSIKRGEYGEILFIEGQQKWRGSLSGESLPLD